MARDRRVALVERETLGGPAVTPPLVRYQYTNHLESSCIELDDNASPITYEEYAPFGATLYSTSIYSDKRYRYSGKECEGESGFYYFGARYYAPHLARWISCDPLDPAHDGNLYSYVDNNPIRFIDPNGAEPVSVTYSSPSTITFVDPRKTPIQVPGAVIVNYGGKERLAPLEPLSKTAPIAWESNYKLPSEGEYIPELGGYFANDAALGRTQFHPGEDPLTYYDRTTLADEQTRIKEEFITKAVQVRQAKENYEVAKLQFAFTEIAAGALGEFVIGPLLGRLIGGGGATVGEVGGEVGGRAARFVDPELKALVEEALQEAKAATRSMYHGGGEEIAVGRACSTTPNVEYAGEFALRNNGRVVQYEIPAERLDALQRSGAVLKMQDSIAGTGISGEELRFTAESMTEDLVKELKAYRVK
jgi:RHS repeat-associated protein